MGLSWRKKSFTGFSNNLYHGWNNTSRWHTYSKIRFTWIRRKRRRSVFCMIGSKAIITKDNKKDKEVDISVGASCVSAPERMWFSYCYTVRWHIDYGAQSRAYWNDQGYLTVLKHVTRTKLSGKETNRIWNHSALMRIIWKEWTQRVTGLGGTEKWSTH